MFPILCVCKVFTLKSVAKWHKKILLSGAVTNYQRKRAKKRQFSERSISATVPPGAAILIWLDRPSDRLSGSARLFYLRSFTNAQTAEKKRRTNEARNRC